MKCPHCNIAIHEGLALIAAFPVPSVTNRANQTVAPTLNWRVHHQQCPECYESIIRLERVTAMAGWSAWNYLDFMAYPRSRTRPIAKEVPDPYRQDLSEASMVLSDSPKASAALSRRCLQAVLKDMLGTTKKDLYDQIEEVTATGKLPSHIVEGLHDVRNVGNIAAHSMKSTSTGTIVDVEPGEAEWNLEVLEMLFDFCFVLPARAAKQKAALTEKLKDVGKGKNP